MAEMRVVWTDRARNEFQQSMSYYQRGSEKSAQNFRSRLLNQIQLVQKFPGIGPKQDFVEPRNGEIRYRVEGHFKILYSVLEDTILIVSIFDTRQDPSRLEELGQ